MRRKPNPSFLRHYLPSQAVSIPYNLGFGIPSLATTPSSRPSYAQRRHVVFAKVKREPSEQFVEMRKFSEQHTWKSGTYFCMDKGVTAAVIKRLVEHMDSLGAPFCPCRHYDDKPTEVQQGFYNCPYHPMYLKNMRSRMVLAAAVVVAGEGFRRCGIGHGQWCGIDHGRQFMMKAMEGMVQAVVADSYNSDVEQRLSSLLPPSIGAIQEHRLHSQHRHHKYPLNGKKLSPTTAPLWNLSSVLKSIASAASSLSDFQDELSDQKLWNESIWIRSSVDFLAVDGTEAFRNFRKWWWSKLLGGWRLAEQTSVENGCGEDFLAVGVVDFRRKRWKAASVSLKFANAGQFGEICKQFGLDCERWQNIWGRG
nr:ferredoxin-thioredoxin reductase catalytic chain, chloroplastic [Ipomoea batatas]